MKRLSLPIIGVSIVLSGCNSTPNFKKVSESEIPNYQNVITDFKAGDYVRTWVQPTNKAEKCEMALEGYSETPLSTTYTWDGSCKDGKAEGLGKISATNGSLVLHEIAHHNQGITDQYFFKWIEGTNQSQYGMYIRENDKMTGTLENRATLKPDGDIDVIYSQGEQSLSTGLFIGNARKVYNDGTANFSGVFGNLRFFGTRKSFNKSNQLVYTTWGLYDVNAEKPDQYIILKKAMFGLTVVESKRACFR